MLFKKGQRKNRIQHSKTVLTVRYIHLTVGELNIPFTYEQLSTLIYTTNKTNPSFLFLKIQFISRISNLGSLNVLVLSTSDTMGPQCSGSVSTQ